VCLFSFALFLHFSTARRKRRDRPDHRTVTDPSKAAIASATVAVTNEATTLVRTAKTNSDGDFVVPLLRREYSVSVPRRLSHAKQHAYQRRGGHHGKP